MERTVFDRETLLDLTVNVIPLVIILFFVVAFAVVRPFGFDAVPVAIQYSLLIGPFVGLAILTYYAGKAIAGDEQRMEAAEHATGTAPDDHPEAAVEPAPDDHTPAIDAGDEATDDDSEP